MVTKTLSVVTDKKPFGNVAEAVKAAVKELLEEEAKKQFQQDTDKQAKEQKIRRMLKKVNIDKLKIVILKNCSKKTHFEVKNQILFVNPQV
ncbi:hypothetical protein, partial [Candidatus Phytoplasma asteris]|uniref:hypothetical protein n=1 Tax=Candidatus Phytoplasma asteris TaxID=85620 RepID=UPI0039E1BDA1